MFLDSREVTAWDFEIFFSRQSQDNLKKNNFTFFYSKWSNLNQKILNIFKISKSQNLKQNFTKFSHLVEKWGMFKSFFFGEL